MNKNILITGAGGFVGQRLTKTLIDRGFFVVAMVRDNTNTTSLESSGAKIVKADLRRKESLAAALEGIDVVVHLATTMKGPWEEYLESTVNGTRRLLEAAKEKNVQRFIFMSSIAIYDVFKAGQNITEASPLAQKYLSNYEKSKIQAEGVVMELAKDNLLATILRSGVIYGPGGALYPPRLGFSMGANHYLIIGSGQNRIPLVYIDNLIEAIASAINQGNQSTDVFNIVDDQVISQRDYLHAAKTYVNPSLKIMTCSYSLMSVFGFFVGGFLKLARRASPIRKIYLYLCSHQINYANQKAKDQLGWRPSTEPAEVLKKTMQWLGRRGQVDGSDG